MILTPLPNTLVYHSRCGTRENPEVTLQVSVRWVWMLPTHPSLIDAVLLLNL